MKKISILIPTYNEEENVDLLFKKVKKTIEKLKYEWEIIFVDNASRDKTVEKIVNFKIKEKKIKIKIIKFARNFGSSQPSYLAGIKNCSGDAAILMDSDLQDPPELIEKFIKKWEEGFQVVYGKRVSRKGSIFRIFGYKLFYRVFKFFSQMEVPLDAGDFSLVDRKVIEVMKQFDEADYYPRGVRAYVGFKSTGINYIRQKRYAGKSSLSFFDNLWWAKKSIINFSFKPLEIISSLCWLGVILSFGGFIYSIFSFLNNTNLINQTNILLTLLMLIMCLVLAGISLICEYLAKIFEEVKHRPNYVISEIID